MEGTGARAYGVDRIRLNLLGPVEASLGGRPVAFRTHKSLALLAFLAVDQYRGPFLAGMLLPDAPDYEAWIERQRTYWRGVASELLDRLATRRMVERNPAAAINALERWTYLNPDEELAWQRLVDAHLR